MLRPHLIFFLFLLFPDCRFLSKTNEVNTEAIRIIFSSLNVYEIVKKGRKKERFASEKLFMIDWLVVTSFNCFSDIFFVSLLQEFGPYLHWLFAIKMPILIEAPYGITEYRWNGINTMSITLKWSFVFFIYFLYYCFFISTFTLNCSINLISLLYLLSVCLLYINLVKVLYCESSRHSAISSFRRGMMKILGKVKPDTWLFEKGFTVFMTVKPNLNLVGIITFKICSIMSC